MFEPVSYCYEWLNVVSDKYERNHLLARTARNLLVPAHRPTSGQLLAERGLFSRLVGPNHRQTDGSIDPLTRATAGQ